MPKLFNLPKVQLVPIVPKISNKQVALDTNSGKRIKASFRCPQEYRQKFSSSHCLLPISVGQLSHSVQSPQEGSKFAATIELINSAEFKKCTILVDDIIQVPTYSIILPKKTQNELLQLTLAVGDKWIKEHSPCYQNLNMPYEIKRWENVTADADFNRGKQKIIEQYKKDLSYQKAFHDNIEEFLTRLKNRGIAFDPNHGFQQCLEYLINENAGMGFVWPKWGAHFEIYPSGRNSSMAATYDTFIEQAYPGILKPVALRFVKRNLVEEVEIDPPNNSVLTP